MTKAGLAVTSAALVGLMAVGPFFRGLGRTERQLKQLSDAYSKLQKEYGELRQRYQASESFRENIQQPHPSQPSYGELKKGYQAAVLQRSRLHQEKQKLKRELSAMTAELERSRTVLKGTGARVRVLETENETLKKDLSGKIESTPAYLAWSSRAEQQADELRTLRADKQALIERNKRINQAASEAPRRMKEMAKQNQKLIRETTDMHYNLGVFFLENENFSRAAKEFERALDFNPNDPKIHYNLGYLYAEALRQPDRALSHFKKFLELDPDAKEAEAVRGAVLAPAAYNEKITRR